MLLLVKIPLVLWNLWLSVNTFLWCFSEVQQQFVFPSCHPLSVPRHVHIPQNHLTPPTAAFPRSGFRSGPVANHFGTATTRDVKVRHKSQPDTKQQVTPCHNMKFIGSLTLQSHKHNKSHGLLRVWLCGCWNDQDIYRRWGLVIKNANSNVYCMTLMRPNGNIR